MVKKHRTVVLAVASYKFLAARRTDVLQLQVTGPLCSVFQWQDSEGQVHRGGARRRAVIKMLRIS